MPNLRQGRRVMWTERCTDACYAMPECVVCHKTKHPRGRDPGMYAASGYCDSDCQGNAQDPQAGHLWPNEKPVAALEEEPGKT